jgi:hypothetical protein
MTMWAPIDGFMFSLGFGAGGALIWFFRPKIEELVIGANKLSAKLHAQADALAAKAAAAKAAVTKS